MGTSSTVLLQRGYLQTNSYLAVSSALAWGAMYAHRVDSLRRMQKVAYSALTVLARWLSSRGAVPTG